MTSLKVRLVLIVGLGALAFGAATLATGGVAKAVGFRGAPAARQVHFVMMALVQDVQTKARTCDEVRERLHHPSLGEVVRTVQICR